MAVETPRPSARFLSRVQKSPLPPAVVIGTGTTALSIARALQGHGVPVLGIEDHRLPYTSYSGAWEFLSYDRFYEPPFIDFLDELARVLPRKAALFFSGDEHVLMVSKLGRHLQDSYFLEIPEADAVEVLMNKHRFAEVATEKGWPIPQTFTCESVPEVEAILPGLEFPVILKPELKNRLSRTYSPQKSFRCETADELLANYRLLAQWEKEVVIQQWIPGGDDQIFFSFHYFASDLSEVAAFEGKKIRQWLPQCGSTSCAVGVEESRVTDLSRRILTEMRSAGFCSVEYKRDPRTDRFYIMEPTVGRVNLQVGVAIANGVDIVSRGYFHLIGRPYPREERRTHHVKWLLLPQDLRSALFYVRQGELTWKEYRKSVSGPKVILPWDLRDPKMLWGVAREWKREPLRPFRRVLRRLRRGRGKAHF